MIPFLMRYVKPYANLAFVRTGGRGRKVLIDQGSLVFPLVHNILSVSLETMKLEVERMGTDALITRDNLRVDVKAEFYIKVKPVEEAVLNAARSLGDRSVDAQSVSELVFEKLVSALRSVAATKDLVEIHAQRDEFASAVHQLVFEDLQQNGLTLESVTVSRLDQTSQELLSDMNLFDAQGKRKITEITQAALVERNRLEREAERDMTLKNVETRKSILDQERDQAEAEAGQKAEIAKIQAAKGREAETYSIEQERQIKVAEIEQDQSVRAHGLERDRQLIAEQQELEKQDVERIQAVELANRQKEVAIADAERQRAEAEKKYLEAQAQREKSSQGVINAEQLAHAEREAEKRLIAAKQSIEEERIKRQTDAEVAAFAEVKKAEAERQAAQLESEAEFTRAEAKARADEQIARGNFAGKRVDVDIARAEMEVDRDRLEEVDRARVEIERQALEYKQTYSEAALKFEIEKLQIEANRDVQQELARSIGEFMSRGNMNIFGDPDALTRMTEQYARGMGISSLVDGAMSGLQTNGNGNGMSKLGELVQELSGLVQRISGAEASESEQPAKPETKRGKSSE